jgi:hypothetical protein
LETRVQSFSVIGQTPRQFVKRLEDEVRERDLSEIVAVALRGDGLRVTFSWMGRSRLDYRLFENEGGFTARLERSAMSPFHAPFRQAFDERLEQVLASLDARIE